MCLINKCYYVVYNKIIYFSYLLFNVFFADFDEIIKSIENKKKSKSTFLDIYALQKVFLNMF